MYPAIGHAHAKDRWPKAQKALLVVTPFKFHLNFDIRVKKAKSEWTYQ